MRKLIASTFVSLDGVMQAPGGPEEDPNAEPDIDSKNTVDRIQDHGLTE